MLQPVLRPAAPVRAARGLPHPLARNCWHVCMCVQTSAPSIKSLHTLASVTPSAPIHPILLSETVSQVTEACDKLCILARHTRTLGKTISGSSFLPTPARLEQLVLDVMACGPSSRCEWDQLPHGLIHSLPLTCGRIYHSLQSPGVSSSEENNGTPVALHLTCISPFLQVMRGHAFPLLYFMSSFSPPLSIEKKCSRVYLAMRGSGYIDKGLKNVNTSSR